MRVDLLTPDRAQWADVLKDMPHDFYHLPEFVVLSAQQEGGEPYAFYAQECDRRLLIPLIVRPITAHVAEGQHYFDVTCPYGYPGPLFSHEDPDFAARALDAFLAVLRTRDVVSCFLRLHPLYPVPLAPLCALGRVVYHGETVSIDLTLPDEEIWRQTRKSVRNVISQALRAGYVVRFDGGRAAYETFIDMYYETMDRLGAATYYYFSRDYFHALWDILGDSLHLCCVEIDGAVAAAALFTEVSGIVQYHLCGTRSAYAHTGVMKLMIHAAREWAKERGNRILHLGGGNGAQHDSLFYFKAGFSKERHPFITWRIITDEAAYDTLVGRWQACLNVRAGERNGYFPAYRDPGVIAPRLLESAQ